jgi:type II secretory pathway pseudopilin PulG
MRAQMDQADAPETPLRGARSRAWIGRAAFEAALIVFGLVGALLIDEWRDTRERNERVRAALASIDAELEANRAALQSAIANHDTVIASLQASTPSAIYQEVIISGAPFSAVAWDAARDAGVTNELDHTTLLALGHAYRALAEYMAARTVFTNYLYTNDLPALRHRPLALVGWLNDLRAQARGAEKRLASALGALAAPPEGH